MLSIAYVSVLINVPRTLDVSSVFGYLNYQESTLLHNIVTALHLSMLDVFILSTARALYLQMQKPIPSFFIYALLGSNVFYFLSVVVLGSLEIGGLRSKSQLDMLWGLRGIAFDATVLLIIVINIILFVRLYRRLSKFIATVVAQAKATAITAAPPPLTREPTAAVRSPALMAPASPAAPRSTPASPMRTQSHLPSPAIKQQQRHSPQTSPKGSPRQGLTRAPSNPQGAVLLRVRTTTESLHPAKVAARALLTLDPVTPPADMLSSPSAPEAGLDLNAPASDEVTEMAAPTIRVHPANNSDEFVLRVAPATPVATSPNHSSEHAALTGLDRRDSDSASRPVSPSRATTPQQNPKLLQAPSSPAAPTDKDKSVAEKEKEKEKEREKSAERAKHSTPVKVKVARQMTMPVAQSPKHQQTPSVARTMTIRPPAATGGMATGGSPSPLARTTTTWNRAPTISKAQGSMSGGSADPPPAISSHEQRVAELRRAVRTLSILSACVFFIGFACIGVDLPDSLKSLLGSFGADDDGHNAALCGPDPSSYAIMHVVFPFIQQLNLAIVCWYVWTPWFFRAKYRAEKGLSFWDGLRNGADDRSASKYDLSKKGANPDSKLARANTLKSVVRVHTASVQLTGATAASFAAAATVAVQVARQARDATGALCSSPPPGQSPGAGVTPLSLHVAPMKHAWGSMGASDLPKPLAVAEEDEDSAEH